MHIYNKITVPAIVIAYALSLVIARAWWEGLVGIAVGYGVPWLIGEIYLRLKGREGLGLGDGMLLAMVGALLGWRGVIASLFGGSIVGSVIGIIALVASRKDAAPDAEGEAPGLMTTELPFGPFLGLAAVFYLFAEPWIRLHFQL
jgi:leader peptidase (prepilin peptidase)/N-methyltransferase